MRPEPVTVTPDDVEASPITVLIVEDHALYRDGLRLALESTPDIRIIGEATTKDEAVAQFKRLRPRVVLMDVDLPCGPNGGPNTNGIAATREINALNPRQAVVIVTAYGAEPVLMAALEAGATGFLVKDGSRVAVIEAIRDVVDGRKHIAPVMQKFLVSYAHYFRGGASAKDKQSHSLTEREIDVLSLVARGWTDRQIASRLFLSVKTIEGNVAAILVKLDAPNRTGATFKGLSQRILDFSKLLDPSFDPPAIAIDD